MRIHDMISRCARIHGDETAYVDGPRRITWREIDARSDRLAAALQRRGVAAGDTSVILSQDRLEVLEHWFACLKIGAVRVGANYRYSAAEVAHVVADSGAGSVLVEAACRPLIAEALEPLREAKALVVGFGGPHDLDDDLEVLIAPDEAPTPYETDDAEPVALAYTAGSTGSPKGVIWTHGGMREGMRWLVANVGLRHEDRWLSALPAAAGPLIFASMNLVNGMTIVLPGGRHAPERFLALIAEERITGTMLVPTMLSDAIARLKADPTTDVSTLRLLAYGSMSATATVIREARRVFGCEVQQWYGSTEMTGIVAILRDADHAAALAGREHLLGSCGKPLMHAEIEVRDPDGAVLGPEAVGELWVRTETLFAGYRGWPDETAEALVDGWFRPGDIARVDDEGYLSILDRKNFMIISGGYNVYPTIVETVLAEHPAVREVAAVGAPHPRWGEAVAAVVTLHDGARAEVAELIEHGRTRLARWESPKHVEIVAELPRGATGKVDRRSLRDGFRAHPERLSW